MKNQDPSLDYLQSIINLYDQGLFQKSLSESSQMIEKFPDSIALYNLAGASNLGLMKFDHAIDCYKQVLRINPDYAEAYFNMGIALKKKGDLEAAIYSYKQALKINPDFAGALNNIGNILKDKGDIEAAINNYKQAIKIKPDNAETYFNLGNILSEKKDLEAAINCFDLALKLKPTYFKAYLNMGIALKDSGDLEAAIDCYKKAIKIRPNSFEAYNNMGIALKSKGDIEAAIDCYKKTLEIKPDESKVYINLCSLLEKSNNLTELRKVISEAKNLLSKFPDDLLIFESLYYFRLKKYNLAQKLITKVNIEQVESIRRPLFLQMKARIHHYQKNYKLAYDAFVEMNRYVISSSEYNFNEAQAYFGHLQNRVNQLKEIKEVSYSQSCSESSQLIPTFLIGFPRSGTTLLDTILRTHSKIDVIEEKEMLLNACLSLGKELSISDIENFSNRELKYAKQIYYKELEKFVDTGNSDHVIDKLPLNITDVPIIHRLFPTSKFILVLRHPLDVILSCWMQLFKLNPAMANMLEIDRIVDLYVEAMSILELSEKRYSLFVHRIKYEDLVQDMDFEISNLLNFLGLDWENELRDYQDTAIRRGIINTPSYSQVVEPIYKTASYRWEKYRDPLEKYFFKIEKWTKKYGYTL